MLQQDSLAPSWVSEEALAPSWVSEADSLTSWLMGDGSADGGPSASSLSRPAGPQPVDISPEEVESLPVMDECLDSQWNWAEQPGHDELGQLAPFSRVPVSPRAWRAWPAAEAEAAAAGAALQAQTRLQQLAAAAAAAEAAAAAATVALAAAQEVAAQVAAARMRPAPLQRLPPDLLMNVVTRLDKQDR